MCFAGCKIIIYMLCAPLLVPYQASRTTSTEPADRYLIHMVTGPYSLCKKFIDGFYHFRVWNVQLLTEMKWTLHALDFFNGQVDTFSLIFGEPPVKTIWTRVVSVNMSLIWILLCLGQPNYLFQVIKAMWALIRGRICDFKDVIKPGFSILMDSCKVAFENWWTQAH